ncbi:hypothetical protein QTP88_025171 [Uroleucon formosanum]
MASGDISWRCTRQIVRNNCKRKATEYISERPNKIIRRELLAVETTELLHNDMSSIRKSMYRERRKIIPAAPTSLFELIQQLKTNGLTTHRNETFCHVDEESKIVIFTTNSNLEYLVNNSHTILGDGTFYVCPAHFEQLYTIHVLHKSIYVQVVYCLLPSKTTDIYEKMWHLIKTLCKKELKPQNILLDFELSAHNGVWRIFPNAQIKCCRFHLGQAWYRQITKLGLKIEYDQNESEISNWLKYFFGLAFLPCTEISEAFYELFSIAPDNQKISAFSDYILANFIENDSRYPPHLWAEPPSNEPRTTNGPESYHRHLKDQFYNPHPSIYNFIEVIKEHQAEVYLKLQSNGQKSTNRKSKVISNIKTWTLYKEKKISRLEYLKTVGFKFQI